MKVTEIFTPSDYPLYTYVERDEDRIEDRLREALSTPGEIVSVSGPSKSGKTVLIEKVAGRYNLITVTGAGISDASHIWDRALDWMEAPTQTTATGSATVTDTVMGVVTAEASLPLIGSLAAKANLGSNTARANATGESRARTGMAQVVREIRNSSLLKHTAIDL